MHKVIIIEDESIIRKGLRYTFEWENHNCMIVGEAENGIEGLKLINKVKPDIVIVDINMPKLSGIDMLKKIDTIDFETIILTGYDDFSYAKDAIELRVSSYLLKPVDNLELAKALDRANSNIIDSNKRRVIEEKFVSTIENLDIDDIEFDENYSELTNKIVNFIESNYYKKILIDDLVDLTYMSRTHINSKFKQETGKTITNYLNTIRLKKAIKLMRQTDLSIEIIAERVGYTSYRYFITVFKKYLNYTPTEFMRRYLNK